MDPSKQEHLAKKYSKLAHPPLLCSNNNNNNNNSNNNKVAQNLPLKPLGIIAD